MIKNILAVMGAINVWVLVLIWGLVDYASGHPNPVIQFITTIAFIPVEVIYAIFRFFWLMGS